MLKNIFFKHCKYRNSNLIVKRKTVFIVIFFTVLILNFIKTMDIIHNLSIKTIVKIKKI